MRCGVLLLVFVMVLPGSVVTGVAEATTQESDGPQVTQADQAVRYAWPESTTERVPFGGQPGAFAPVSFTAGNHDQEMLIAIELRNTSDQGMPAPDVSVTLSAGEVEFDTIRMHGRPWWIPAGQSAFYFEPNPYGGTVLVGDWTDIDIISRSAPSGWFQGNADHENVTLEFEQRRIVNTGSDAVGPLTIESIIRDQDGVFLAQCMGSGHIDVPASHHVRIPPRVTTDSDAGVSCLNGSAATEVATHLGTGPIQGGEWILLIYE